MAKILVSKRNYIDELATNQTRNLMVICERLFLDFEDKDEPVQMAVRIAEKLVDEPELIGKMVQKDAIGLLVRLWTMEGESFAAELHSGELQQLHYLGFLSVEEDSLMVNMEAKDLFFFVLKSRKLKPVMEKYYKRRSCLSGVGRISYAPYDFLESGIIAAQSTGYAFVYVQPGSYGSEQGFRSVEPAQRAVIERMYTGSIYRACHGQWSNWLGRNSGAIYFCSGRD